MANIQQAVALMQRQIKDLQYRLKVPATPDGSGLATPDIVNGIDKLGQVFTKRRDLATGTDILTLDPGYYVILNPTNSPITNDGIFFVDVSTSTNGTVYMVFQPATGERWQRVVRPDGQNKLYPATWTSIQSSKILWAGSLSTVGTPITLTDVLTNYSFIEVSYSFYGNSFTQKLANMDLADMHEVVPSWGAMAALNLNNGAVTSGGFADIAEFKIDRPADDQLQIEYIHCYNLSLTGAVGSLTTDGVDFSLNSIIGWR